MKKKYYLLVLMLGLFGCAKVKDPIFKNLGEFKVKSVGLQSTTIGFKVTYYNPNNFGVTVKEAEADVYGDSIYLGKFVQDSTISVARNADFSIPFSGNISHQTALQLDPRNLGERNILLKADGSVKVGKAGIFVTRPVHYQGTHRLDEIRIRL